jgi:predicted molibdopterin-dependent oxidoreductase YjgC
VIATNSAHSWIDQRRMRDALARLDFLVVQDMYPTTDTALLADLVLPAAGWGEKEGSFINSERRVGVTERVAQAPGHALSDFYIFKLLAEAWGCGPLFSEWTTPEATFGILTRLSRGQPCDMTGITGYSMIDEAGGIQWPFPQGSTLIAGDERRLFDDGRFYHPDGRARFLFEEPRPVAEALSADFPLMLLTGRGSSSQWHTQTRTAKSALLCSLGEQEPYVEISPQDAAARTLAGGDWTLVVSARGSMRARARVTPTIAPGQVFVPMHYAETNRLTNPSFDPYSRQPSYKSGAVDVRPAHRRRR